MLGNIGARVGQAAAKGIWTVKVLGSNPVLAIAALGGVVAWQIWKGKKDTIEREIEAAE